MSEEKRRLAVDAREGRHDRISLRHVGGARRGGIGLRRVPDLCHQLASLFRVCGEDIRAGCIDPVVGQGADPVGTVRVRKAKHGDQHRQHNRNNQPERGQADGEGRYPRTGSSPARGLARQCDVA